MAWRVYVRQGRALSVPLTPAERDAVVHDAAATARPLLGVFYLGAGLFKHNRGHLARQTSCSTVYVIMAAQVDASTLQLSSQCTRQLSHCSGVVQLSKNES